MQIFKALRLKFSRLRRRICIENGGLIHIAMNQTDTFTLFEVDSRKKNHGRHLRKLPIKVKPRRWLFSGWNWAPSILSRPTIAVTGPP